MQIPVIVTDNDELSELVKSLNNRFDQIVNEFNKCSDVESNAQSSSTNTQTSGTVNEGVHAKYIRLGIMPLANAPNGTLFEDDADGLLKYKDHLGVVTVLT